MAVNGLLTSYGLTGGRIVNIDAVIDQLDPSDTPFQSGFSLGGFPALPSFDIGDRKYEWQDDTLLVALSTINEGATFTNSDTTLTVADGNRFAVGDVIRIDTEHLLVTAISGNDLTVTRGFAGTTAASHSDGAEVNGVGQALAEGSDAVESSHTDRSRRYNVTQIFGPRKVSASRTEQMVPKYGLPVGGEFNYQIIKEATELSIHVEKAIAFGQRYDDGSSKRTMGGFDYFIQTNVDSSSTSITLASVRAMLSKMWKAGSKPSQGWVLVVSLDEKLKIDDIDTSSIRLTREDTGRGQMVDYFDTSLGRVQVIVSRYYPKSTAHLFTREQVGFSFWTPWSLEPLAKTGDKDSVQLVAEAGFKLKRERHAGKFTALA